MQLVLVKNPAVRRDPKGRPAAFAECYPVFHVTPEGDALCAACARERETHRTGFSKPAARELPEASDVNWEDPGLYCDDCGERIESAYAEPEEDDSES
jgi:hypothetical protein